MINCVYCYEEDTCDTCSYGFYYENNKCNFCGEACSICIRAAVRGFRDVCSRDGSGPIAPCVDQQVNVQLRISAPRWIQASRVRLYANGIEVKSAALDLNHISDFGTTWQASHSFKKDSEQFRWYDKLMSDNSY